MRLPYGSFIDLTGRTHKKSTSTIFNPKCLRRQRVREEPRLPLGQHGAVQPEDGDVGNLSCLEVRQVC